MRGHAAAAGGSGGARVIATLSGWAFFGQFPYAATLLGIA